nr:thioredoxin domain-containing protein [Bacillus cereus]
MQKHIHQVLILLSFKKIKKQTEQEVNRDEKLTQDYGVEQTPNIVVNGTRLSDPYNYEQITNLIEKALKEKK